MYASRRRRSSSLLIGLALALALATAGAAPVEAQSDAPATDAAAGVGVSVVVPAATTVGSEVTFTGHGYGHGRGMGQYGALGYAVDHGWSYWQILDHFYGGTVVRNVGNPEMSVELLALNGKPLVVTAPQVRVTDGAGNGAVDLGTAARFTLQANGTVTVERGTGCVSSWQVVTGTFVGNDLRVSAPGAGSSLDSLLRVCEATGERAYRGSLSVVNHHGLQMTINHLPTESYLRGVVPRESPASWGALGSGRGMQALKAQAVAARSYALSSTRATGALTCDTTACQVYLGAGFKTSSWTVLDAAASDQAVAETAGEVRVRTGTSTIARTEFSSSTGGYTVGGTFPAVIDEGDDTSRNPNHTWTATYATSTIASKLGLRGIRSITVTGRNGLGDWGGRVTQVVVVDGAGASHTYTGVAFRTAIGTSTFKSDWFTVVTSARTEAENVVRALYRDVLGRGVDPSGLATWTNYVLTTGSPRDLVARLATSRERMNKLVAAQYRLALLREPEPGGLETWVRHLESGHGVYDLQIGIYGSGESLQKLGGGDVPTWVGAVYSALLGRPASASEQQYWAARASTYGRASVVAGIAGSSEASMRRLTVYYQTFLLRGVDPAGRATFLPMMTGRGDFDVPIRLGGSPAYWARAQTRSY